MVTRELVDSFWGEIIERCTSDKIPVCIFMSHDWFIYFQEQNKIDPYNGPSVYGSCPIILNEHIETYDII